MSDSTTLRGKPLSTAFLADCPYGPDGVLIERLIDVNQDEKTIRVGLGVHAEMPITRTQRAHPEKHPRHLSGGLMIHLTGIVGFVHAYYLLNLRHADGWIGYGARVHDARFSGMCVPGDVLEIESRTARERIGSKKIFVRYAFEGSVAGRVVFKSEQSAVWTKIV